MKKIYLHIWLYIIRLIQLIWIFLLLILIYLYWFISINKIDKSIKYDLYNKLIEKNIKYSDDIFNINITNKNIIPWKDNPWYYINWLNIIYYNEKSVDNNTIFLHEYFHYIYNQKLTIKQKYKVQAILDTMYELNIDKSIRLYSNKIIDEYNTKKWSSTYYDELQAYYISQNVIWIKHKTKTDLIYKELYEIYFNNK